MSVLRRMRDMTVATWNEMLEQSEDPIRLIDQYLAEQQDKIKECDELHRRYMAHAGSLRRQYLEAEAYKRRREEQAEIALKVGEEEAARLALQDKMLYEEKSEKYKQMYDESKWVLIELEDQLNQIKEEYREAADKRDLYLARMETARLQRRLNESWSGSVHGGRSFRRLEDRVRDMEWEARSLRDIRRSDREFMRDLHQVGRESMRDVRRLGRESMMSAGEQVGAVLQQAQHHLEKELQRLREKIDKDEGGERG